MPVFPIKGPDGTVYEVQARNEAEAVAGFRAMYDRSPKAFEKPGMRRALKDVQKLDSGRGDFSRLTDEAANNFTFGLSNVVNAGIGAAGTGVRNLAAKYGIGEGAGYSAGEFFDAYRLNSDAQRKALFARKPVSATTAAIAGGVGAGGAGVARKTGAFVLGKTAPALEKAGKAVPKGVRAAQGLRAAGVGALQAGVTEAGLAAPGEELERGATSAAFGAAAVPAMAATTRLAGKAAKPVSRAARRVVGPMVSGAPRGEPVLTPAARKALQPPGAEITSLEKLVGFLRNERLDPAAIQAAADEWNAAGGPSPTLFDIVNKAGGSPGLIKLLQKSGAPASSRVVAEDAAKTTTKGVQRKALDEVGKLTTGEPRTPTQIRADVEAARAAGQQTPPAGVPREAGAAAFAADLNAQYDASRAAYEAAYREAEAARPESAIVPDDERPAVITSIYEHIGRINPKLPVGKKVVDILEGLRRGAAPDLEPQLPPLPKAAQDLLDTQAKDPGSTPEKLARMEETLRKAYGIDQPVMPEAPTDAYPLTVMDLHDTRDLLGRLASEAKDAKEQRYAIRAKEAIDLQLERLASEGKIVGDDPEVVEKWVTAITGFADHKRKFGDGIAARLTEREPGDPTKRAVSDYQIGELLFGKKDNLRSLNDILADIEPTLGFANPTAVDALRAELYGRIPPESLDEMFRLYPEAAKRLLPPALVKDAQDALAGNAAVDAGAADDIGALELGEGILKTPSEEFRPAVDSLDTVRLPTLAAGGKQALINVLESPEPGSTGLLRALQSDRMTRNLGATFGPDETRRLQGALGNIEEQANNSRKLNVAVGGEQSFDGPLLENLTAGDLAYWRRGAADAGLKLARMFGRLSPEEHEALIRRLVADGRLSLDEAKRLLQRPRTASTIAAPGAARGFSVFSADGYAPDDLSYDYGLDMDF